MIGRNREIKSDGTDNTAYVPKPNRKLVGTEASDTPSSASVRVEEKKVSSSSKKATVRKQSATTK